MEIAETLYYLLRCMASGEIINLNYVMRFFCVSLTKKKGGKLSS